MHEASVLPARVGVVEAVIAVTGSTRSPSLRGASAADGQDPLAAQAGSGSVRKLTLNVTMSAHRRYLEPPAALSL